MSTPAIKFRDGTLQVVIWRNTSTSGQTYYSATPQRSYKQGDDTWRETDSLRAELMNMMPYIQSRTQAGVFGAIEKGGREAQLVGRRP